MVYDTIGASPVEWAGKPYPEIAEIAGRDGSILVVPVGSLEQHGYHLPTITDTLLCGSVVHAGAERVVDEVPVLVTPPVWTGHSPHHFPFGGTASLPIRTLLDVLGSVADSALGNGFDALLLVNGHGGNIALIQDAVKEIGLEHEDTEILGLTYFHLAGSFIDEIRETEIGGIAHAGEFETSLLLHLRPDLVNEERIEGTFFEKPYDLESRDLFDSGPLSVHKPFDAYTESGASGDPTVATAEKGEEIFRRLGEEFASLLEDIHEENR